MEVVEDKISLFVFYIIVNKIYTEKCEFSVNQESFAHKQMETVMIYLSIPILASYKRL